MRKWIDFNKERNIKILICISMVILCFFLSFTIWPFVLFRQVSFFSIGNYFYGLESAKVFFRHLFGPITPIFWQVEQLFLSIRHYGLGGMAVWINFGWETYILGGSLYLYGFYQVIKKYFNKQTTWNNWKLVGLIILFSLFWFLWGESHMAFGV